MKLAAKRDETGQDETGLYCREVLKTLYEIAIFFTFSSAGLFLNILCKLAKTKIAQKMWLY